MTTLKDILDFIDNPKDFNLVFKEDHRESYITFLDEYGLSCGSNAEFFLAGNEFGAEVLIHARSYEDAYEAWIDASETIPESEVPEAYGIDDCPEMGVWKETHPAPQYFSPAWSIWCEEEQTEARRILSQWDEDAREGKRKDYPELIEGYQYQSNSSGTGIVSVPDYAWLREADADLSLITIVRRLQPSLSKKG
jgi:hypothetical protein